MLQSLLNALSTETEVKSNLDELTTTPPDQDTTPSVEVKPVEVKAEDEPITFRVFHEDVFKGHKGQGYIDPYDSRWSSEQSDSVFHITLNAQETIEELQRKFFARMGQTETSTQNLLFHINPDHQWSVQNAPKLSCITPGQKIDETRRDYPSRCLWLANLPSCESQR